MKVISQLCEPAGWVYSRAVLGIKKEIADD